MARRLPVGRTTTLTIPEPPRVRLEWLIASSRIVLAGGALRRLPSARAIRSITGRFVSARQYLVYLLVLGLV
jgi:hypothetical protein